MAEVELISSRMVLGEAIRHLDLDIIARPNYFPIIGEAIARRFEDKLNRDNKRKFQMHYSDKHNMPGEVKSIRVDTFTVPSYWLNKEFILIAGKQGHFRLMHEDAADIGR